MRRVGVMSFHCESLKVGVKARMLPCVSFHMVTLDEMGLGVCPYQLAWLRESMKYKGFQVHRTSSSYHKWDDSS